MSYQLTDIQLDKLCYDIFIQLNPDKKTLTSYLDIRDWDLKIWYMNKDNTKINSIFPPTAKQINQALKKLVDGSYIVKISKLGVASYMTSFNQFESPYEEDPESSEEESENDESLNENSGTDDINWEDDTVDETVGVNAQADIRHGQRTQ